MQLNYLKKRFNLLLIKDVIEAYVSNWLGLLFFVLHMRTNKQRFQLMGFLIQSSNVKSLL
jgi:hypothetical protein